MSFFNTISAISRWFGIILSPLFLSSIPFYLLLSNYGFHKVFLGLPVLGLIMGICWAENVRKNNNLHEYRESRLMETNLVEETWEREKKKDEIQTNYTD